MRGKIGIVVGLAAGYVLGSRAGRERYEQIKTGFLTVWNADPVQKQVGKAKGLVASAAFALPSALWDGAVKITKAATTPGRTPGQRLDSAIKTGKASSDDVARGARTSAAEVKKAADEAVAAAKAEAKKTADN
ncbi:hypothetical protein [Microbacterium dextranolyticum]|uniref:YtxH domain-containing protein n=1 Tax=Microbacterium dextranolyticum TaxID=36806 RepID=A0A9W6M4T7_9MICO|nr:hypothetical protein [Microbacterium dextranolyticum]MBM7461932.1 hypothetical protein [Microbacterium dextranolyticum]GLJ94171.1 hypothetical protein GCM10017591_02320 [Microbacterium dextranolyticum]